MNGTNNYEQMSSLLFELNRNAAIKAQLVDSFDNLDKSIKDFVEVLDIIIEKQKIG